MALLFCVFAGWVWQRDSLLDEIKQGYPQAEQGLFWKIWPVYVKFMCPLLILFMFWHSIIN